MHKISHSVPSTASGAGKIQPAAGSDQPRDFIQPAMGHPALPCPTQPKLGGSPGCGICSQSHHLQACKCLGPCGSQTPLPSSPSVVVAPSCCCCQRRHCGRPSPTAWVCQFIYPALPGMPDGVGGQVGSP